VVSSSVRKSSTLAAPGIVTQGMVSGLRLEYTYPHVKKERCMKKLACVLVLFLLSACGGGVSKPQPASKPAEAVPATSTPAESAKTGTKLEAFLGKHGQILVKDLYDVGHVKCEYESIGAGVDMKGIVIYEPGSSQKIKGLRVEVTQSGSRSSISFIDMDELQSLSDAIAYVSDLSKKWAGQIHQPYTEITYISKGEFDLGFYQEGTKATAYVRSGTLGNTIAFLKTGQLDAMKDVVDKASVLLGSK